MAKRELMASLVKSGAGTWVKKPPEQDTFRL
jgi:hypothetical protein